MGVLVSSGIYNLGMRSSIVHNYCDPGSPFVFLFKGDGVDFCLDVT